MSRFPVIVIEELPKMEVIETIDSETIITDRMSKLKQFWSESDPPAAADFDVENLEFDPLRINQEASTYFETLLRDRVNQAARAVTLAYAVGGDLDAIGSRYPGGCPRLALVDDPRDFDDYPEDWEADDRYRRRIWLSPSLFSANGLYESYVFWALTADATLHDATATSVRGTGKVTVTIMTDEDNPTPTDTQLNAVMSYLNLDGAGRKGLTDDVNVVAPTITSTAYRIRVWLLPGFDQETAIAKIEDAIDALIERQRWLGFDHTLMAIDAACAQPGVYNVVVDEPAKDVSVTEGGLVHVTSVTITYVGRGE